MPEQHIEFYRLIMGAPRLLMISCAQRDTGWRPGLVDHQTTGSRKLHEICFIYFFGNA